jgi:hypothetical protein
MQADMHYYGTYCMARAAGLTMDAAQIVASAAQYVDDNVHGDPIVMKDGARLQREPTAHHITDVIENINPNDQRNVWVPFHFLPGNETEDGNADYTIRLRCRKDSEPARFMVEHVLKAAAADLVALERLGITAHVYADTFSHHGFSGVGSRHNMVESNSFTFDHDEETVAEMRTKGDKFFSRFKAHGGVVDNVKSWRNALSQRVAAVKSTIGEIGAGALGHGSVATYPDQPYLVWSFEYSHPARHRVQRDNPADFLEACVALHEMFRLFAEARADYADGSGGRAFAEIADTVRIILAIPAGKDQRVAAWQDAAASGKLFAAAENIPPYLGDAWTNWLKDADGKITSYDAMDHPPCRFHIAAGAHRSFVLHELMPSRNLLIA